MKIRDVVPGDKTILLEFICGIQDAEVAVHDSRLPGTEVAGTYYQTLLERDAFVLLAEKADRPVGFVAGWLAFDDGAMQKPSWRRYGLISDVYVIAGLRGTGLAQRLLQAMSERLSEHGAERLRICAVATNVAAIAAYARFGFAPFEVVFDKPLIARP